MRWDPDGVDTSVPFADDTDDEQAADRLPEQARRALVTLLTNRYLTRARNRVAWDGLVAYRKEIAERLDEMYLDLIVDIEAEVAFKRQQDGEDVPRLLRRDKPLARDAAFVLIFLRRECAFADPADGPVVVTRDQISEFLRAFRQDGDGDGARFSRRVDRAISALEKPLQLLTADPAVPFLLTVSPVVVPLVGADEVRTFEAEFLKRLQDGPAADDQGQDVSADGPGVDVDEGQVEAEVLSER